jgi:hypothetical protein
MEFVPDDTTPLYFFIWAFNSNSVPGSNSIWTVGSCSVENYANIPVYVAGQRMQGTAAAAPVAVVGNVATTGTFANSSNLIGDVGVQYRGASTGGASIKHIVSVAGTNATIVKGSNGRLLGWCLTNTTAGIKYVKIHNSTAAPTPGSGVSMTIGVPGNATLTLVLEGGAAFTAGIGYTIVGLSGDADTTAVAAGDIVGDLFYA